MLPTFYSVSLQPQASQSAHASPCHPSCPPSPPPRAPYILSYHTLVIFLSTLQTPQGSHVFYFTLPLQSPHPTECSMKKNASHQSVWLTPFVHDPTLTQSLSLGLPMLPTFYLSASRPHFPQPACISPCHPLCPPPLPLQTPKDHSHSIVDTSE